MKTWSSTSLGYLRKYCPQALAWHVENRPADRSVFHVGVAAHAVLEECGKRGAREPEAVTRVAEAVAHILMTEGRDYFGVREPPMPPDAVIAGRDLALAYLATHDLPNGDYEAALYANTDGHECNPAAARARAMIDLIYEAERGDEDFSGPCVVVRDYKSAWTANDDELDTLQRRMQAVLAWFCRVRSEHVGIVLEVENLRTGRMHERTIWLDEEGVALLRGWWDDLLALCAVADAACAAPLAAPGVGCLACPFVGGCDAARAAQGLGGDVREMAVAWLAATARRAELGKSLKVLLGDCEPVAVPGGSVGFQRKEKDVPLGTAPDQLLAAWYERIGQTMEPAEVIAKHPAELSLLQTLAPGKTGIEAVGKLLFPERKDADERRKWVASLVERVVVAEFGEAKA